LFKIATKNIRGTACAEICCELGSYYMKEKDYNEAVYWYYLAANASNAELDVNYVGFIPNLQMSACYLALGNMQEASKYNNLAALYKPNDPSVLANNRILLNL